MRSASASGRWSVQEGGDRHQGPRAAKAPDQRATHGPLRLEMPRGVRLLPQYPPTAVLARVSVLRSRVRRHFQRASSQLHRVREVPREAPAQAEEAAAGGWGARGRWSPEGAAPQGTAARRHRQTTHDCRTPRRQRQRLRMRDAGKRWRVQRSRHDEGRPRPGAALPSSAPRPRAGYSQSRQRAAAGDHLRPHRRLLQPRAARGRGGAQSQRDGGSRTIR